MQPHYDPMPVYLPIDPCVPFQLPSPPCSTTPDSQYSSSPSPPDGFHHYSFDFSQYPVLESILQPIQVPQLTYTASYPPSDILTHNQSTNPVLGSPEIARVPISKSRPPNINYNLSQHPQQTLSVKSLNLTMASPIPAIMPTPTGVAAATPSGYQPSGVHHSVAFSGRPLSSTRRGGRSPNRHHLQQRIPHPYARLFAKKDQVKRRKIWNHTLEKSIFTPYELSTIGAPQRRKTYVASLEAHIDRIHSRLLQLGSWPVELSELNPFIGLNSKTAKSMVAGLQHDASVSKLKLLELERANADLSKLIPTLHLSPSTRSHGQGSVTRSG